MSISPVDIFNKRTPQTTKISSPKKPDNNQEKNNETLKGVLLNNYIKNREFGGIDDFEKISCSLLIPEEIKEQKEPQNKTNSSFDYKKILKPIAISALSTIGALGVISICTKNYSKAMVHDAILLRPDDLARNINILEEPHFAMYRVLRDPNAKNVAGFIGVALMSGVTLACKTMVDGIKEIWIKKQNCDIERDFQEGLIQVETDAFRGKLDTVNSLLKDNTSYFKKTLSDKFSKTNFKSFLNFKGNEKEEDKTKDKNNKKALFILGGAATAAATVGLLFAFIKNYHKTLKNLDSFTQKYEDKIIRSNLIKAAQNSDKQKAIDEMKNILKSINAKDTTMKENLGKISGISEDEILEAIKEIKNSQIYAQAPEALGGISEKIQYYCYINEDRGHLYNWILNPESKFNKYLFLSFSAISAAGYLAKTAADAVKEVAVSRENSKNELNMRRRLVDVEIRNFKSKKMSAVNPMIDNFIVQLEKGKPKEELKELAENILIEIKNGPPYVYS